MKVISFYNHKGGVGKTSLTTAVAGQLVVNKKKVLMIDSDSQANLTNQFMSSKEVQYEFADYLFADKNSKPEILQRAIQKTRYKGLYYLPTKKLSEGGRIDQWARTQAGESENRRTLPNLMIYLQQLGFEYVLFDMPPSYSELDKKILLASDEVIPVLKIEKDSVEGLADFYILLDALRDGEEKPIVNKLIFNMRNKSIGEQNKMMPQIDALQSTKYIIPMEQAVETAKKEMKLLQNYKVKAETKDVLHKLTKDIMEDQE
ncbi:MAG: ParA family protein [Treponema sp.]|nr:ParA family protein [Treponema sp.]